MMYLKNFGFEEDVINTMCENIPALAVEKLIENELL